LGLETRKELGLPYFSEQEGVNRVSRRFFVIIEQDEDGKYIGSVPSLPGCHTQADTLAELEKRIEEGIRLYLEESSGVVPEGNHFVGVYQVEVRP
jgi:predicted RNase H-like HicB family nuclease